MRIARLHYLVITLILTLLQPAYLLAADAAPVKKWELTEGLLTPESVLYDTANDLLYVSNINGSPTEKDGNGYISIVSPDGKLLQARWIAGLNAPKGMGIYHGKLYVADIDVLVEIDINSGAILNRIPAADSVFLNDVAVAKDGSIYVSGSMTHTIYRYKGTMEKWLTTPDLEMPNGLLVEEDRLVVGNMGGGFQPEAPPGQLLAVSLADKSITRITKERIGLLDGVESGHNGHYLVTSHMAGELLHIDADGKVKTLVKLEPGAADLDYIAARDMIVIPMLRSNKLLAYKLHP